jgi:hypothetical protein
MGDGFLAGQVSLTSRAHLKVKSGGQECPPHMFGVWGGHSCPSLLTLMLLPGPLKGASAAPAEPSARKPSSAAAAKT